ncbi:hypothetical protein QBC42DRAFT_248547 [Cladorrhinum samala]|uniref:CFEM domain-containing protein n=1 Tax=Cladorrhinum samala TaxID=585594 RepID=A0AAV9HXQ4_9PEZI|nr:hypothetical protein QBC42DRAFT_248547 [Cladorrhinum samala]
MKSLLPIAFLLLGLTNAQNLSGQPDCATNCIISAVSAAGCAPQDTACQCGPTKSIIGESAAPCLLASCTGTQLIQAESAGEAQCSSYFATAAVKTLDGVIMNNMKEKRGPATATTTKSVPTTGTTTTTTTTAHHTTITSTFTSTSSAATSSATKSGNSGAAPNGVSLGTFMLGLFGFFGVLGV